MKITAKILAVVLALIIALSCMSTLCFAATAETVVQYGKAGGYLALGDSIGRGCGAEGFYLDEFGGAVDEGGQYDIYKIRDVQGCYPYLVAKAVGCNAPFYMNVPDETATYWPCCFPGMTTAVAMDLYGIDDNFSDTALNYSYYSDVLDYFGYEGSSVSANGKRAYKEGDGVCGNIIELTQKADLITIELGMCDIFYRAYRIISNGGFLADGLSFDVDGLGSIADLVENAIGLLKEGYKIWEKNYPLLLQKIKELNPDATIVMVGSFNLVNQMTLVDDTVFPLGSIFSGITDKMNKQYEKWADEYGVLYANVANTETLATESDWSVLGKFLEDNNSFAGSHPSQKGHDYMARQILSVLPEKQDTKDIVVDLGRFNKVDSVLVDGIPVNNYTLEGFVLTVPGAGPLATNLTITVDNGDGTTSIQTYCLSYDFETGYTAYRKYGTNDIEGKLQKPFKLIGKLFTLLIDAIKGLFK